MKPLPEEPLISVVMPVYGAEPYLAAAIKSVLDQTYRNVELLVADDASPDRSKQILDDWQDERIVRLHNTENQGYLKTCNKLLLAAKGDLVTFQDADDTAPLNRLEIQLNEFRKNPNLGLCSTNYVLTHADGSKKMERNWEIDFNRLKSTSKPNVLYCGATFMVCKEVIDKIGVYREFFNRLGAEDFDWLYRIIENYPAIHISDHLYFYRQHPSAVKVHNTNIRKYFAHDIVNYLRAERLAIGTDSLENGNRKKFDQQIERWEAPFRNDPSHLIRLESQNATNNRHYWTGLWLAVRAVIKKPLVSKNYIHFARMVYTSLRKVLFGE
ncbi:MAG TPA: glycosyltransferase family 2 protein [Candidatus Lambdaproteobacteria bacterium]|nr:glycosyltransferase family 2 protein [Candidatus Lambdaproteobacteria bacterium]